MSSLEKNESVVSPSFNLSSEDLPGARPPWARRVAATAGLTLLACGGCYSGIDVDEAEADAPAQGQLLHDVEVSRTEIHFVAGAESVELELVPNRSLLAPGVSVVRDGERLSLEEAGLDTPYQGHVKGDPDSWVRVSLGNDAEFEGLIFSEETLFEVRLDEDGLRRREVEFGDFLENPTESHHRCDNSAEERSHATYFDAPGASLAVGCSEIDIALVGDYTHVQALGGAVGSENERLARINEADGIFRADLNYGFVVEEIVTFSQPGGPSFNTASAGTGPLNQFGSWKQSNLPQRGLAHLFVARTTSGAVGVAYVGSTCSARFGSGVSNYLGTGRSSTIVVTHELGHNFGSNHDAGNSSFVMAPSVNPFATEFSPASEGQINSHVASVSCFEPCDPTGGGDGGGDEGGGDEGGGDGGEPPPTGCEQSCGEQSPSGCWCDSQCAQFGDCCDDYAAECLAPPEPAGDCEGSCGSQSAAGCWCDAQCAQFGDCCDDYTASCG